MSDIAAFHSSIPDKSHRVQLLHHVVTLGIEHGVYIEASPSMIIRTVFVNVPASFSEGYLHTMDEAKHK